MKLYFATVHCHICYQQVRGEPMSNQTDAELFMRIDHFTATGHWTDESKTHIHEVVEAGVLATPSSHKEPEGRNAEDKPRSLRSNRKR